MDIAWEFRKHHFKLSPQEEQAFKTYLQVFQEYNSHTNISAIREETDIVIKHFIDSLYASSIISDLGLETAKVLDIGSGGGLPGIPLKIIFPNISLTLLDSVQKKTRALELFKNSLHLENTEVITERAENLAKNKNYKAKYDVVVSRATAYMDTILTWAYPFLKKNGKIILYKMPSVEEQESMKTLLPKLWLALEWELQYTLADKERILYVFNKK